MDPTNNALSFRVMELEAALKKVKARFEMLAGLAASDRITDRLKRKKWQIVADEAKAGAEYVRTVI
jgi:hypothetical protein